MRACRSMGCGAPGAVVWGAGCTTPLIGHFISGSYL